MPVFVFNIIYKPLLTSGTRVFLFNIILTEVDTFTSITHHYSNAITQFITQFITQIPLLKSLLIITQMSFSLLIITPPLLKGHFANVPGLLVRSQAASASLALAGSSHGDCARAGGGSIPAQAPTTVTARRVTCQWPGVTGIASDRLTRPGPGSGAEDRRWPQPARISKVPFE